MCLVCAMCIRASEEGTGSHKAEIIGGHKPLGQVLGVESDLQPLPQLTDFQSDLSRNEQKWTYSLPRIINPRLVISTCKFISTLGPYIWEVSLIKVQGLSYMGGISNSQEDWVILWTDNFSTLRTHTTSTLISKICQAVISCRNNSENVFSYVTPQCLISSFIRKLIS